ncbi:MAG TPA: tRNA (adenosine(37)-N6)-dimethylallyltransferase MiaA [Terriglobales bacterium]|nr:tRNA (adenosine(37)-N6)-dimethylallyltransferase MiaA [Terriglobales bacterium]
MNSQPSLLVIAGPTASGKTALSLAMAKGFNGEIVSCDSVAVYRDFEIGTAKPSPAERLEVPHHMIDVASPGESFTAGEYARQARVALKDISGRGKLPIVVGGTGLYLRALLEGLFAGPQRSEELRARLVGKEEARGKGHLHRILLHLDRVAASKIHANDTPKVIRAIEVCLAERAKMSELWEKGRDPLTGFRIVRVGLNPDRALLYDRINRRCEKMFRHGLVEETQHLLELYPQLLSIPNSPLNALGYRQAVQVVRGELTEIEAIAAAQQAHRNYAKRQLTWFRKEPEMRWMKNFGDEAQAVAAASAALTEN